MNPVAAPKFFEDLCLLVRDRDLKRWFPVRLSSFEIVAESHLKTTYRLTYAASWDLSIILTQRHFGDHSIRVRSHSATHCLTPYLVRMNQNDCDECRGFKYPADAPLVNNGNRISD